MRRIPLAIFLAVLALPSAAETPSLVKIAELSARLCAMGVEASDPVLIVSAVRLAEGDDLLIGLMDDAKAEVYVEAKSTADLNLTIVVA